MSDGCIYAGVGMALNFGWKREDIIETMKILPDAGYTAKTMTTIYLMNAINYMRENLVMIRLLVLLELEKENQ